MDIFLFLQNAYFKKQFKRDGFTYCVPGEVIFHKGEMTNFGFSKMENYRPEFLFLSGENIFPKAEPSC